MEYETQENTGHVIREEGPAHKYFYMMPNYVDDIGLTPYEFRLYAHLKRVAGENGTCYESTERMSEICKMSRGQVSEIKASLVGKGLIRIREEITPGKRGGRPLHRITIIDIWRANMNRFCGGGEPSSPDEHPSSSQSSSQSSSPGAHEEDPLKKTNKKTRVKRETFMKSENVSRADGPEKTDSLEESHSQGQGLISEGVKESQEDKPKLKSIMVNLTAKPSPELDKLSESVNEEMRKAVKAAVEIYRQGGIPVWHIKGTPESSGMPFESGLIQRRYETLDGASLYDRKEDDEMPVVDGMDFPQNATRQPHKAAEVREGVQRAIDTFNAKQAATEVDSPWEALDNVEVAVVLTKFSRLFGVRAPTIAKQRKFWIQSAKELLEECGSMNNFDIVCRSLLSEVSAGRGFAVMTPRSLMNYVGKALGGGIKVGTSGSAKMRDLTSE